MVMTATALFVLVVVMVMTAAALFVLMVVMVVSSAYGTYFFFVKMLQIIGK